MPRQLQPGRLYKARGTYLPADPQSKGEWEPTIEIAKSRFDAHYGEPAR